jgi:hypothetical protein
MRNDLRRSLFNYPFMSGSPIQRSMISLWDGPFAWLANSAREDLPSHMYPWITGVLSHQGGYSCH